MISTSWNTNIHDIFPTKVHKSQLWSNALWELSWPYIDFLFSIYYFWIQFFSLFWNLFPNEREGRLQEDNKSEWFCGRSKIPTMQCGTFMSTREGRKPTWSFIQYLGCWDPGNNELRTPSGITKKI